MASLKAIKITWLSVFVALAVIGATIKIPAGIVTSVALDSFPALLASVLLGGPAGAIVGSMGHLLSALLGGMPMGPFHIIVAIEMAILLLVFALFYRKGHKWLAAVLFVLGNTFAAPLPFLFIMGEAFYVALVPTLLCGSIFNMMIALLLIPKLEKVIQLQRIAPEKVK